METHLLNFKNIIFIFLERCKLNETMINILTFAILYSHNLMHNGGNAIFKTCVK